MKRAITTILFWGACWGITESTLGYVLHLFSMAIPGLPGMLMFPIAFIFMHRVYDQTQDLLSVIQIALVASSIKLTDLMFGGLPTIYVVNPALSLLIEGLAVAMILAYVTHKQTFIRFHHCFFMGWIWRVVLLGYMLILSRFDLPAGLVTNGWTIALRFLFLESIINAILMKGYLVLPVKLERKAPSTALAWGMLLAAILLQGMF